MKKIVFTLAFVALTVAANAQFILGGSLGFNTTGGNYNIASTSLTHEYDMPATKTVDLTIAPAISYVLNEKMQIGLGINYNLNTRTNYGSSLAYYNDKEDWTKLRTSSFGIAPYFRYYFANAGKFSFFCEATLGLTFTPRSYSHVYSNYLATIDSESDGPSKTTDIAFTIVPGVNYRINQHLSADCYIDLAGLYFSHSATKNYVGDDVVSTDSYNNFGLLCNASAQTINAHFNAFRIGFNYHF